MTFGDSEISVEGSQPVEVYTVTIGIETFRWTSNDTDVVINAQTFTAISIERGATFAGAETRDNVFEVTVDSTNPFARKYINIIPADRATITVDRYQRLEGVGVGDIIRIFNGVVQSVAFSDQGKIAVLGCQPVVGALSRPIPRHTFSSGCNHILYAPLTCRVSRTGLQPAGDDYQLVTTVSGVSGAGSNILTVPAANGFPNDWFTAGQVEVNGTTDVRLIISHTNDEIRLLLGFPFPVTGTQVTLQAGCAHDPTACTLKFANFVNYGGTPFVPDRNPFQVGLT